MVIFHLFYRKGKQLYIKLAGNVTTLLWKNYFIMQNCEERLSARDLCAEQIPKESARFITAEKLKRLRYIFPKRMPWSWNFWWSMALMSWLKPMRYNTRSKFIQCSIIHFWVKRLRIYTFFSEYEWEIQSCNVFYCFVTFCFDTNPTFRVYFDDKNWCFSFSITFCIL